MNIIKSVFDTSKSSITTLRPSACCTGRNKFKTINAFDIHKETKVGLNWNQDFLANASCYRRSHLVQLGPHSTPIFLFKDWLEQLRRELVFKRKFSVPAGKFLSSLARPGEKTVYVGLHARRGDRLANWRSSRRHRRASLVGRFEAEFFNTALERLRREYNRPGQRVVFIATSDDPGWLGRKLLSRGDVFYPRHTIAAARAALPNRREIGQIFSHARLAVKGSMSYGTDLAVLAACNHTVLDYGTFGLWAGLLAGGRILLPSNYSADTTPDSLFWSRAGLPQLEYISAQSLNLTST